ncbi:MAG: GWxTD domain-containing protein [FCB group bacterium]|jgi:GWxTD domain-containing protein
MKKYLFILVVLILSFVKLESKNLSFSIDGALFKSGSGKASWEMFYSFPDNMLNYPLKDSKYTGELYIKVKIKSPVIIEAQKEWIVTYSKDKPDKTPPINLVGQKSFLLSPGQYIVEISIKDMNDSSSKADSKFNLIVRNFSENKMGISDLELAQVIENSASTTFQWNQAFYKNQLYVVPNPSLFFGGNSAVMPVYLEIYNAQDVCPTGFLLEYKIFDAVKREITAIPRKLQAVNNGLIETDNIPIDVLPTGTYFLQALISFPIENPTDTISTLKKFYINNPENPPDLNLSFMENATFEKSEFATLTPEQTETEYIKAKYIANPDEIEEYERLSTLEAKQRFLFRFWLGRDTDTTTIINERLLQYRELIRYANINFSYGKMKDGWRTERGRILLKYGQPSQRDQKAADKQLRAYETWFYPNYQGGVYFYFVDMQGYGNFRLVSSTVYGELRNDNWYQQYVPSHNSEDWKNTNQDPNQYQNNEFIK